jgi:hypothetical protein
MMNNVSKSCMLSEGGPEINRTSTAPWLNHLVIKISERAQGGWLIVGICSTRMYPIVRKRGFGTGAKDRTIK